MADDYGIAYEARELAKQVAQTLIQRERAVDDRFNDLQKRNDERHSTIQDSIKEVKTMLTWVGGVLISLIISVLGWSLVQQYNANEATQKALQEQVRVLQSPSGPTPAR